MEEKKNQNQLNIELPEEIAEGIYSNLAVISHSNAEFILDFIRIMPGVPKGKVKSRMILAPSHAKRLMRALQDNVMKYEQNFGPIKEDTQMGDTIDFPINFGNTKGEA